MPLILLALSGIFAIVYIVVWVAKKIVRSSIPYLGAVSEQWLSELRREK